MFCLFFIRIYVKLCLAFVCSIIMLIISSNKYYIIHAVILAYFYWSLHSQQMHTYLVILYKC